MQKTVLITAAIAIFLLMGFSWFNNYIYDQKQTGGNIERYTATLSGEVVCLPHADTSGPQTLECAIGLKTETGEYYAVDLNALAAEAKPLETGEHFSGSGTVTPIEMLSSDHWQKYDVEGIFSVTSVTERSK